MQREMISYKTPEQKKRFYRSGAWLKLRQEALQRDNYECQSCKREGKVFTDSIKEEGKKKEIRLNVHHIKEIEHRPDLALTLSNLETICIDHHNQMHDRNFKRRTKPRWNDERW